MVPKRGDLQKIIKDGLKLQRWMPEKILQNIKKSQNQKCNYMTTNWTKRNNYKRDRTEAAHMVRPCSKSAEGRLPKIALKWMPQQKRARGRLKGN